MDFDAVAQAAIERSFAPPPVREGSLVRVVGLTLEAKGLMAPLGAVCEVIGDGPTRVQAEVVGFQDHTLYLMPFNEPKGIGPGARVRVIEPIARAQLGPELLGRVVGPRGEPLDGKPAPACRVTHGLDGFPLNAMERGAIHEVLDVGVKTINGMLTVGKGQRIGLVAGSGVGKSSLLGMLTRYTKADLVVIGLIGERGREVQAFIQESLRAEGLARSVVVAAPANVSAILRLKAVQYTHLIAEYFREQGKNVLLLVDSLTRVAHAQREIGLAVGEPPTAKGYPPSVFSLMPTLIERAGMGRFGHGSITAMYTVLAENDDSNDPIVDISRASLDGQVMLSRALADAAHYPAIDLNGSISRVMQGLVEPEALKSANRLRRLWSLYQQNQDLIQVGAYQAGSNPDLDAAIRMRSELESFLCQEIQTPVSFEETRDQMMSLAARSLTDTVVAQPSNRPMPNQGRPVGMTINR